MFLTCGINNMVIYIQDKNIAVRYTMDIFIYSGLGWNSFTVFYSNWFFSMVLKILCIKPAADGFTSKKGFIILSSGLHSLITWTDFYWVEAIAFAWHALYIYNDSILNIIRKNVVFILSGFIGLLHSACPFLYFCKNVANREKGSMGSIWIHSMISRI